jgi:DNA-binding MarR family transcriptional regulator
MLRMETRTDSVDRCITDVVARYEEIDPEVEGVVDRVATIERYVAKAFEETLRGRDLSHGEYKLLLQLAIAPSGRRSAGDLSRALMLSTGGMTNRLDRLEASKLIRRVADPDDRRGVLVELSPSGTEVIDRALAEEALKEVGLFTALSAKELVQLNRLLRKVLVSLEDRYAPTERPSLQRVEREASAANG